MKIRTERINLTLPNHISEQLNDFTDELNAKKSHIVAVALERYYDYLDIKVAQKRSMLNEESYTISEVRKELGL